ncbi:MAG: molybdenum cofactor guanylyltransferase [Leucobacter sp.]
MSSVQAQASQISASHTPASAALPRFDAVVLAGGRGSRLGGADKANLELHGARLIERTVSAARAVGAEQIVVVGPQTSAVPGAIVVRENPSFAGPLAALAAGLDALPAAAPSPTEHTGSEGAAGTARCHGKPIDHGGQDDRSECLGQGTHGGGSAHSGRTAEWTLLLACDLVNPGGACRALIANLRARFSGGAAPGDPGSGSSTGDGDGILLEDPDGRTQWLAGIYRTAALRAGIAAVDGPLDNLPLRRAFSLAELVAIPTPAEITADIDTPEDLSMARTIQSPHNPGPHSHDPEPAQSKEHP